MPPTIKEVAERAAVSVSTVSRVLNDYPHVSGEVRLRVRAAMKELEYRPDVAARAMRTGTSRAVGFVVSDISNPLFSAIAKGADTVLHPQGYSLVLANAQNDASREAELLSTLRQRRVDGLIVAVADERARSLAERLAMFQASVLVDRDVPGSNADAVCSDHANGMAQALAHLAGLGHRRVALIAGSRRQLGSRARILAFRRHAARLSLVLDRPLIRTGELSRETGYLAARELLESAEPPTAIIAGNNQLTVGAVGALRDLGLCLPAELSLVACDDTDLARLHDPPIDVIDRDPVAIGTIAAELLLARLADLGAPPVRVAVPTAFVPRGSSARPRELEATPRSGQGALGEVVLSRP